MKNSHALAITGLVIALALFFPKGNRAEIPPTRQLISESSLLAGLWPPTAYSRSSTQRPIASDSRI